MATRVLTTAEEFAAWLDEHRWFHDGCLLAASPTDFPTWNTPNTVELVLETIVRDGGYRAGNLRTIRTVRVRAEGVHLWEYGVEPGSLPYPFCDDGVHVIEEEHGIAFELAAPDDPCSRLVCDRLVVIESRDREERIEPFVQDGWVSATVARGSLPTPQDWVEAYRARGVEVVWRYFAGERRPAEGVPSDDYTGWYLQLRRRIELNEYGLFFACARRKGDGFEMSLELQDQEARDALWPTACEVLGGFPSPTIQCGNCFFNAEQWRRFLADGTLPVAP